MHDEFVYVKCRWPEDPVPQGAPCWIFYEVREATDVVTRTVDLYADGTASRNSIQLAAREGPDFRPPEYRSLVHGAFLEHSRADLDPITASEFLRLWTTAIDKPWPLEQEDAF